MMLAKLIIIKLTKTKKAKRILRLNTSTLKMRL